MIPLIQLPYKHLDTETKNDLRSVLIGFTVGLVLCSQLGLLVWAFLR